MATEMTQQGYSPDSDITNYYYDPGSSVFNSYCSVFGVGGRPCTALIDRDGNVRYWGGAVVSHEADWRSRIEELL
ncbi:hypothetical protein J7J84_03065 [bacterium]|nr:hypothetical protein [bacterium]